ncbi:MAG: type II secretion system F family protein [Acidimicrobiales bacterium]
MSNFAYTALAPNGRKTRGRVQAENTFRAEAQLADLQLTDIQVKEQRNFWKFEGTKKKKVKRVEVMHFSRQLAAFVRAGVPIVDAMAVIGQETPNPRFSAVLIEVADALRGGETFADAMARFPEIFPRYYLDILRSSELTGNLDTALDQLAGYVERDLEARRKISSALLYPCIVLCMAVVTVAILTGFVLPRFKAFFDTFDAKLPLPTRILIGFGDLIANFWWAILILLVAGGMALYFALKTEGGKLKRDSLMLKAYAVGSVVRFAILERFCRILAAMVKAGVPLPDAMAVATDTTANRVFKNALVTARERMLDGEGLAGPLESTGLFPGVARQMVRVGEETGTLDQQLETAAEFYEIELEYKLKRLTTLFEPAVILFVGLVVGFVAIALVSAMYGIYNQVDI